MYLLGSKDFLTRLFSFVNYNFGKNKHIHGKSQHFRSWLYFDGKYSYQGEGLIMAMSALQKIVKITYKQLLRLGLHVGNSLYATRFYSRWMLIGIKARISIIHPFFTFTFYKNAIGSLGATVGVRGPIWFISGYASYFEILEKMALRCGESFALLSSWLFGLFCNFMNVFSFLILLRKYLMRGFFLPRKYKKFLGMLRGLKFTRMRLPESVYVPAVFYSYQAKVDARYSFGTFIGLVDTDCSADFIGGAIPGNDEAISCVFFHIESVGRSILISKSEILKHFFSFRKIERYYSKFKKLSLISFLTPYAYFYFIEGFKWLFLAYYRLQLQDIYQVDRLYSISSLYRYNGALSSFVFL